VMREDPHGFFGDDGAPWSVGNTSHSLRWRQGLPNLASSVVSSPKVKKMVSGEHFAVASVKIAFRRHAFFSKAQQRGRTTPVQLVSSVLVGGGPNARQPRLNMPSFSTDLDSLQRYDHIVMSISSPARYSSHHQSGD